MDVTLTKEADALLCILYKNYLERRATGQSRSIARKIGNASSVQAALATKWPLDDLDDLLRELDRATFITCFYGDNLVDTSAFSDAGIIYMENRFQGKLAHVVNFLAKIKSLIPFI